MLLHFHTWMVCRLFSLLIVINKNFAFSLAGYPMQQVKWVHPFHVSVIEINHNATDKTLEISCKIFTDDFEVALAKNYQTKVDLINPQLRYGMDTLIKKYLLTHLSIKVNGKEAVFDYLGYENDHEAVYSYIEVSGVPTASRFDITASILYDLFTDQVNIFHITVNGKRKSTKLNYPDKETAIIF